MAAVAVGLQEVDADGVTLYDCQGKAAAIAAVSSGLRVRQCHP